MKRSPTITFLLGLAVFLLIRLGTGQIHLYLRAPMTGLLCATIVCLLLIVWSYGMQPEPEPCGEDPAGDDAPAGACCDRQAHGPAHCACGQTQEHQHDPHDVKAACSCGHGTSWQRACLMGLPFVIGLLLPPHPLGSSAVANRSLNRTFSRMVRALPKAEESNSEKNLYQWAMYLKEHPVPASVSGQAVRVTGFVYRDERCTSNTFIVARFVMMCCAADASPVGLWVQGREAASFDKDDWVTVTGHFGVMSLENKPAPLIQADALQSVECPSQPYLSPWGP